MCKKDGVRGTQMLIYMNEKFRLSFGFWSIYKGIGFLFFFVGAVSNNNFKATCIFISREEMLKGRYMMKHLRRKFYPYTQQSDFTDPVPLMGRRTVPKCLNAAFPTCTQTYTHTGSSLS